MTKNLVIVESPAKAKTIEKFLGKDYKVVSSFGHIADLPSSELGVDVEANFEPKYIVSEDKKEVVRKLKKLVKDAQTVWLASDEDREGEAIAWHLYENLNLSQDQTKRIVFNEITKGAILDAIQKPRDINYDLVNAQQARRVLDRLVGYELSPILWRKVKGGLSAGRVQSVAVRLIVEKERSVLGFVSKELYRVTAIFKTSSNKFIKSKLSTEFATYDEVSAFLNKNKSALFSVKDIIQKPASKSPAAPFTTSTLQQEASRKLYFSVSKTMRVAQRLYESGLITYMRTDSVSLSKQAQNAAQQEIVSAYGEAYSSPKQYKSKVKGAQEAHEAIRPTDFSRHYLSDEVESDQQRLYDLIWKRAIASQMTQAKLQRTQLKIQADTHDKLFTANGEVITFDGFLKVYLESKDEDENEDHLNKEYSMQSGLLPDLNINEQLYKDHITATQRFSNPPSRYTEASLVKDLEELGIGRPSTYAPTISTIQNRKYIVRGDKEGKQRDYTQLVLDDTDAINEVKLSEKTGSTKGKLIPTDVGMIVTDFLVNHFSKILDYHFTAKVEQDFDYISQGKQQWSSVIQGFYDEFHPKVEYVSQHAQREVGERILGTDPDSGKPVSVRLGKYGAMVQIGSVEDEEKPRFASLAPGQTLANLTFEQALDLFLLPKELGDYKQEKVIVSNGRFGPYIKYEKMYVSLDKGEDPMQVTLDRAVDLIEAKIKADAPVHYYENLPVQKGVGRFGPYLKWNALFINVSKKYDFDNLSIDEIEFLIQEKKQKEIDKVIHHWEEQGIRVEKARWGRHNILKGKQKIELPKTVDAKALTLQEVEQILEKDAQKNKKTKKKKKIATAKKKLSK